jgi:hypothetical protein
MASINQINAFDNKSIYEQYIYIKNAYISGNVNIGMEFLGRFKQLHVYDTETFTQYALYGSFVMPPKYSRDMITDMKNLGYPIDRVNGDFSRHDDSNDRKP